VYKNQKLEETVEENIQQVTSIDEQQSGLEVHTNEDIIGEQEQLEDYDPTKTLSFYKLPLLSLLKEHKSENSEVSEDELLENRNKIVETLKNYKIEITKIKATVGPTVTLYEIVPAPGVRIAKIKNLEDDPTLVMFASFPGEVLAQLISPILGEKADHVNPMKGMAFVCFFGALNTWFLISTHSLFIFMLLLISDLTLSRTGELILQNFLSRVSKRHRGKIFGIRRSITDVGGATGPIIGGILWDTRGMRSPFIFSIYIEISLIFVHIFAIRLLSENIEEKTNS
jgi:hypothetical protein